MLGSKTSNYVNDLMSNKERWKMICKKLFLFEYYQHARCFFENHLSEIEKKISILRCWDKRGERKHIFIKIWKGPSDLFNQFQISKIWAKEEEEKKCELKSWHLIFGEKTKKPNDDHPSILPFLNQLSKRKKSRNKRKRTFLR